MKLIKPIFPFVMMGFIFFCSTIKIATAYEVIPVEDGGELSGTIRFKGEPPINEVIKVDKNPEFCGNTVTDESLLINSENKGIENVVVSLEGIAQGKQHPPVTIVLDNTKCHFEPHTLGGVLGDMYEITNSDPVLHNTHLRLEGGSTLINVVMPSKGNNIKKLLTKAGVINANCDAHRFMNARILVFDHPYFAITDKNGEFKISDIPPGIYKVKIWHESLPVSDKEIKISSHKITDLPVELSLKK